MAPTGWRIPTKEDFQALQLFLLTSGFNFDGTTSADKTAKSLASITGWIAPENMIEGSPANMPETNNTSSFNALPVGWRGNDGEFSAFGEGVIFMTSQTSTINEIYCNAPFLLNTMESVWLAQTFKNFGIAIRCIKK